MKHSVCCTLIVIISFMLLPGCGNNSDSTSEPKNKSELSLPRNLKLAFDPSDISPRATAKKYKVDWLKLDKQRVIDTLARYEVTATHDYAEGPAYETSSGIFKEYIVFYEKAARSGLVYSMHKNDGYSVSHKVDYLIDTSPDLPDVAEQVYSYLRKSDYKTSHDLEFESYATAVERVLQLMQSCGLPELKVKTVYALDLETMRKHYEDYANSDAGDIPEFTLSEDDECYLMHFRQIVDGIPLTDSVWEKATRTWDVTESPIIAVYSENGLESFYSRGLYQIETAYQESPLITPLQAAQTLADDYASGIILTETEVSSVELNYVAVYENEDIVLVPAWMFVVSSRSKTPDTIDYRFGVVDAITGKLIRTAVDNK